MEGKERRQEGQGGEREWEGAAAGNECNGHILLLYRLSLATCLPSHHTRRLRASPLSRRDKEGYCSRRDP